MYNIFRPTLNVVRGERGFCIFSEIFDCVSLTCCQDSGLAEASHSSQRRVFEESMFGKVKLKRKLFNFILDSSINSV